MVGDWDGDGVDSVQMFNVHDWRLVPVERGPLAASDPSPTPWLPVAGDWDGDRIDTLSIHRDETKAPAPAPVWALVSGDWDGDGTDTTASLHMPSGQLAVLDEELRSAPFQSTASGSPAVVFDGLVTGPGSCFMTIKNMHTSVHEFHYRFGGCFALIISFWEEWTCCPLISDGSRFGCGMELGMYADVTGC